MIKIGVIGTGGMGDFHVRRFNEIRGSKVVAICDIDAARALAVAERLGVPRAFSEVDELLSGAGVDAVAVATPDDSHAAISLKAISAGKHVLCEKPLATTHADARKMAQAAKRRGVINMVQFSYRASSALQRAHEMIAAGDLGRIVHFEASYLQSWLSSKVWGDWRTTPAWLWRQSTAHGSRGVLGDIGVHIVDFATFPIGADVSAVNCRLKTFNEIKGNEHAGYTLDANDSALLRCELADGSLGVIHTTRWATGHSNSLHLKIHGENGALEIELDKGYDVLRLCVGEDRDKAAWKEIKCPGTPDVFERFVRSVQTGKNDQPDFARGAAVQKVLDACFVSDAKDRTIKLSAG